MEDFNEPRFESDDRSWGEGSYRSRTEKNDKGSGRKRWIKPLILLLVVIAGIGAIWYFVSRIQIELPGWLVEGLTTREETIQVTLPAALFVSIDVEEIIAGAVQEHGIEEYVQGDDGSLTLIMSAEVRDLLLEEAGNNLEEKINTIRDEWQHPYVVSISYDSTYKDYYLVVHEEQSDRALVTAAELYMLAVYYQLLSAAAEPAREVSILIEDVESGSVLEILNYPDDLDRLAEVLEEPEIPEDEDRDPRAGDKVIVTTGPDNLNLRNGPGITYLIIEILRSGTILEVTGTEGVWLEVITPAGREGWVHGDFVEIYPEDD
ncbi:MAG: SH3 domain-containing protein [Bacillota bacterium]